MNLISSNRSLLSILFCLAILLILDSYQVKAQENIRIMSYNILEYDTSSSVDDRNFYFREINDTINPDILVGVEIHNKASAEYFLSNVLNMNSNSTFYNMGTFILNSNNSKSNNAIYYKPTKFTFLSSKMVVNSGDNPTLEFQLYDNLTGNKIIIYGVHFSYSLSKRTAEADAVKSWINNLSNTDYFLAAGDFNLVQGGADYAWHTLIDQGDFIDPLYDIVSHTGDWGREQYSEVLTYATRTTVFGGGVGFGLIYRADLIMNSQSIVDNGGVTFIPGSFVNLGNDGLHFQDHAINDTGSTGLLNQAVSQDMADALYYASDHLPVYADYNFDYPNPVNPPYPGSIVFTQVGADDGSNHDVIEFMTLYRMNLTTLKITNNPVLADSSLGTLTSGGGTFDLSSRPWTDVPAGTFVRLGSNLTNDNDDSNRILQYNGNDNAGEPLPTLNNSAGNQLIAYTGSSPNPDYYIAGIHWGDNLGWTNITGTSYSPGTPSDLNLIGSYYSYNFSGNVNDILYGTRNALTNAANWTGTSWQDYTNETNNIGDGNLPVELQNFTGNFNGNSVQLKWSTATEVKNYGFDIERSFDNQNWSRIGFVQGHGNSNIAHYYQYTDDNLSVSGKYYYRLKQIDNDGTFHYYNSINVNVLSPGKFVLMQNYPNPFNPSTTIGYSIPVDGNVSIKVYDILGREVSTLINRKEKAGYYKINFNASNLASGVYFYRMIVSPINNKVSTFNQTKSFVVQK